MIFSNITKLLWLFPIQYPPKRTEFGVSALAGDGDVEIFQSLVSLQLCRIEVAHTEVEFREALEREEMPHFGFERIHRRQFRLDFLALGRDDRRMITLVLLSIHFSAAHNLCYKVNNPLFS